MRGRGKLFSKGFTLIELLVVLAILGMLAALVGPQVLNQLGGAKSKSALIQIRDLEQALELYKLDVGRFPNSEEGLSALVDAPNDAKGWNGPYLKKEQIRIDPLPLMPQSMSTLTSKIKKFDTNRMKAQP